jgi:hypothetical protein
MKSELDNKLLDLIKEMIEKPLASIDYKPPLEDVIRQIDDLIDSYMEVALYFVEGYLRELYREGASNAADKLNTAAEQYNIDYEPLIPDYPDKLRLLIEMYQHSVEDYALVLRGRLRSSVEARYWQG